MRAAREHIDPGGRPRPGAAPRGRGGRRRGGGVALREGHRAGVRERQLGARGGAGFLPRRPPRRGEVRAGHAHGHAAVLREPQPRPQARRVPRPHAQPPDRPARGQPRSFGEQGRARRLPAPAEAGEDAPTGGRRRRPDPGHHRHQRAPERPAIRSAVRAPAGCGAQREAELPEPAARHERRGRAPARAGGVPALRLVRGQHPPDAVQGA
mmetsp:Transcript_33100/g.104728  ORF Transcript_33100/g.104728 Transcript_33100/m.104728 type:complete len:210 (+) Transcript_33100:232-861(+)